MTHRWPDLRPERVLYPEERPVHDAEVDGFWMDQHPVTVAEFRRFVKATGHVRVAESVPDPLVRVLRVVRRQSVRRAVGDVQDRARVVRDGHLGSMGSADARLLTRLR